jgi:hypothetical protein
MSGAERKASMEPSAITAGLAVAKGVFDTLRNAIGLVRDIQEALPPGEKKETVTRTLAEADNQIRRGEEEIAEALGYQLCRCAYPPTPMLTVGRRNAVSKTDQLLLVNAKAGAIPVHECPRCGRNDADPQLWTRNAQRIPPNVRPADSP